MMMSLQQRRDNMRSLTVSFEVPGEPVPKGRARVTARGTFTPEKTKSYTEWVQVHARQAMQGREPMKGDVIMTLIFWMPKLIKKRSDIANLVMLICDALTGIVYEDDWQVCSLMAIRGSDSENPRVIITVKGEGSIEEVA